MVFIANTPESLVARSDSKNPATTCRGITSGGRPCRRPISASAAGQKDSYDSKGGSLRVDNPRDELLYCWQHKEQASLSARSSPGLRNSATPILEERTSLDTLADRLNLLSVKTGRSEKHKIKNSGGVYSSRPPAVSGGERTSQRPRPQKPSTTPFCCCFIIPLEEAPLPPARPKPRPLQSDHPSSRPNAFSPGSVESASRKSAHAAARSSHSHARMPSNVSPSYQMHAEAGRKSPGRPGPSAATQTAHYLSLIPPTATPQTASTLMAELSKPISQTDEAGYIYMFWLTPEAQQGTPPADAARSLLVPPSRSARSGQRRASEVVASFAGASGTSVNDQAKRNPGTLLLKIGRAKNVQRRLNEWKRQCGYNLSLLRYYPYIPSTGNGSFDPAGGCISPRMMPHSHKVERLIHIELAGGGMRVAGGEKCEVCGKEHREWFQVEATRDAVAAVDEVIRRWSDWDEGRL
ncbi:MAG: hypothetical protein SEPTF4163_005233 [Sporothrix epigloea]